MLRKYFLKLDLELFLHSAKPPKPPQWQAILQPLQTSTWLCLLGTFLTMTILLSLISKARWNEDTKFDYLDCKTYYYTLEYVLNETDDALFLVFLYGTVVEQNQNKISKLRSSSIKIFVGLWIACMLIINTGYRGGLMSVLTVPLEPDQIQKVSELVQDPRPISSVNNLFYNLAQQSQDPNVQKLTEKYIVHYQFEEAIKNCSENKAEKIRLIFTNSVLNQV